MNLLIDTLPTTMLIDNKEVPINWDFRTSILYQETIQDKRLSKEEKILQGLELYYPTASRDIYDIKTAVDKMLWFYNQGKDEVKTKAYGRKKASQAYSFKYDDAYIYAAFMDQYGIDLQIVSDLHWWKFKAMFDSLRDDLMISQIMKYRVTDMRGMDKEQAAFYRRMKKQYALPKDVDPKEQEELDELNRLLKEGGDVSKLLNREW